MSENGLLRVFIYEVKIGGRENKQQPSVGGTWNCKIHYTGTYHPIPNDLIINIGLSDDEFNNWADEKRENDYDEDHRCYYHANLNQFIKDFGISKDVFCHTALMCDVGIQDINKIFADEKTYSDYCSDYETMESESIKANFHIHFTSKLFEQAQINII